MKVKREWRKSSTIPLAKTFKFFNSFLFSLSLFLIFFFFFSFFLRTFQNSLSLLSFDTHSHQKQKKILTWTFINFQNNAHSAIDGARTSQATQPNDFKSTNVKLTTKNFSLTTIANRRCSIMSTILSLSPRHGNRNLDINSKKFTDSRRQNNRKIWL